MRELSRIDAWLAPGEQLRSWFNPVFRVTTSLIFIIGGIGHFAAHDYMLERMEESPAILAPCKVGFGLLGSAHAAAPLIGFLLHVRSAKPRARTF